MKRKFTLPILTKWEFLFCCAFLCQILAMQIDITTIPYMLDESIIELFLKLLRYSGYLLVAIKILLYDKYNMTEILLISGIMLILGLNSFFINKVLLFTFLFVCGMKNVRFKEVMTYVFVWSLVVYFFIIIGSQMGVIDNWIYVFEGRTRGSLGFFYPSHETSVLFYLVALFCYLQGDALTLGQVALIEVYNLWQYVITDSRAGFALIAIMVLASYAMKFRKKVLNKTFLGNMFKVAFPACAGVSIIACLLLSHFPILKIMDKIVSGRIRMGYEGIMEYGVHLWGQRIRWIGNGGLGFIKDELSGAYNYVDCSYIKLLLDQGLLVWMLIMVGYTLASVIAVRRNNKYLALVMAFIALYCIIEPRLMELGFNPFILALSFMLHPSEQSEGLEDVAVSCYNN